VQKRRKSPAAGKGGLATRLAARLGLSVPQVEVIEVRPELIAYTSDLVMQMGSGRLPCSAAKQFGS